MISHSKGKIMNNNKLLSKQKGGISKFMLMLIVGGIAYGAYYANGKSMINSSSFKVMTAKVGNTLSSNFSNIVASEDYKGYGVQLMATKQLDQAKALMNDFARDGYSAFVLESNRKGRSIYKVRLGPYSHKPEAVAVQDKVIRRYPSNPYVKSSLVIYKPN
jgi:septal ring-binding cell division protein DamX